MRRNSSPRALARRMGTLATAFIALFAVAQPATPVANASPARTRAARTQTNRARLDHGTMYTLSSLAGSPTGHDIKTLASQIGNGEPFAIQEKEILDAFNSNLPVSGLEIEARLSRWILKTFVSGERTSESDA